MPHQHRAQRPLLGHGHEGGGDLADLGHPAGGALDARRDDRLHRVDDQQYRLHRFHLGQHGGQLCLGGDVEVVPHGTDPVRTQPYLGRRLLTGDVEHRAGLRHQRARLKQQCGLAHAGLSGKQHHGTGDQAAAQHPVEFVEPGGPGARGAGIHLGDRHRAGRGEPVRGTSGQAGTRDGGNRRLLHGSPGLAAAAAPGPLGGAPPAVGALIQRRGRGITHGPHGSDRVGHQCSCPAGERPSVNLGPRHAAAAGPNAAYCWPARLRHDAAPGAVAVSRRRGSGVRGCPPGPRASRSQRGACRRASRTTSREGGKEK